jgi:VCBS repeat-containing protein
MPADNNQTSSPSNPIGTASDSSQQGWLELDQQGVGGETLKAKQWTTKRRVVDSSQHVGNIHTGTAETAELDKSSPLAETQVANQTTQASNTSDEAERGDLNFQTSAPSRSSTERFYQDEDQRGSRNTETTAQENEQQSVIQSSGDDSLVFERRFETESEDRSSQRDQNNSSAPQQTGLPQTPAELAAENSTESVSTPETTVATTPLATTAPVLPDTSSPPNPLPGEEEGEEEAETISIESSASAPILNTVDSSGFEDTAIAIELSSSLTDTDGSESLSITIEGIPIGATLSAGRDLGNGTWELTNDELTDLTLSPPTNSDDDFSLTITATSTESHGGATNSVSEVIDVFLEAVADTPILESEAATGDEDTAISLDINAALSDIDGSETLSAITMTGVPDDAQLSAGSKNNDGSWSLNQADLEGLQITPGQDSNENFELAVSVTATDANGSTATSDIVLPVTVNALADAATITGEGGTVTEDGGLRTDTPLILNEGDTRGEVLVAHNGGEILGGQSAITFSMDINITDTPGNEDIPLISYAADRSHNNEFRVLLQPGSDGESMTLEVKFGGDNAANKSYSEAINSADIFDGDFHNISVSIDNDGSVHFSFDGTDAGNGTVRPHTLRSGGVLVFGQEQDDVGTQFDIADEFISGQIGEISISSGGTNLAQWDMGVITQGGTVADQSGNGHDLSKTTITGNYDNVLELVNDQSENQGSTNNAGQLSASGQLTVVDPDAGEDHFIAGTVEGRYGALELSEDGSWTYSLNNNADNVQQLDAGDIVTDTINIHSADGSSHAIVMTVNGSNDSPSIDTITELTAVEDGNDIRGTITAQDVDADDAITFTAGHADGLIFSADGSFSFDPGHDSYQHLQVGETQTLTIPVTVTDGHSATDNQNLIVTVTGTNDTPRVSGAITLPGGTEDTSQAFSTADLLANASDVDSNDILTVENLTVDPSQGTLSTNADGTFTFTPRTDYSGEVTLSYDVSDGRTTVPTTAEINLTAENDNPIAVADTYQRPTLLNSDNPGNQTDGATSDTRVTGIYAQGSGENLLDGKDELLTLNDHNYFEHNSLGHTGYNYMGGHDWFADNDINLSALRGGIITFADGTQGIIDTSSNGIVRDRDGDGTIDYEENAYIYYNAYEPLGDLETLEDRDLTISPDTLLANDSDVDGSSLSITDVANATNGTVALNEDGTITFEPDSNYSGEATFTYTVDDSQGGSSSATVTLNIHPVADTPEITLDTAIGDEDSNIALNIDVALSDTDGSETLGQILVQGVPDDAILSAGQQNSDGSWTLNQDELEGLTVTPGANNNQNFTLQISTTATDSNGDEATTTVELPVTVNAINDAPDAVDDRDSGILDSDNLGSQTDGAASGTRVTGIYASGSDVNLLEGKSELTTLSDHSYFDHDSLGHTGYNYMGGHDWFADNDINLSGLRGGIITFEDGTQGIIDTSSNGITRDNDGDGTTDYEENAYIYYNAYEVANEFETQEDTPLTISQEVLLANDTDVDGDILSIVAVSSEVVDIEGNSVGTAEQDNDGNIIFTPGNALDSLSEGESKNVSFTYTVSDGQGGTDTATATITVQGTDNDLTFVSETASFRNVVGIYQTDENGNPISGSVVIDDQNGMAGGSHLADLEPGNYEFFIIANGGDEINSDSTLSFDTSGDKPILLIDGEAASHPVYYTEPGFNPDGKDHFQFESDGEGGTLVNIEDLPGLGDADFGDVVLHTNFEMADRTAVSPLSDTDQVENSVAENAAAGTETGITATAMDADGDAVTYSLSDDADGRFAIDTDTGAVTVAEGANLDFESNNSHSITIQATSDDGTSSTENFTINVTDIDDTPPAPPTIDLATSSDTGRNNTDDITADHNPLLTGTAEAGSMVTLYADGEEVGTTTADENGNWSYDYEEHGRSLLDRPITTKSEADVRPDDSSTNETNNTIDNAVSFDREDFGAFEHNFGTDDNDADQDGHEIIANVKNPNSLSARFIGEINNTQEDGSINTSVDSDWVKVTLNAGETLVLDVDYGAEGNIWNTEGSVDTELRVFNSESELVTNVENHTYQYANDTTEAKQDDDLSPTDGGEGSVLYDTSGADARSLDPYYEFTAPADGEYYVQVSAYNNGSKSDSGTYELWMSIENPQVEFTATATDSNGNISDPTDSLTVTIDTTAIQEIDPTVQTARLIDGAVEGIEYNTTSGFHGYTEADGSFSFIDGDEITFNVGGVTLGTATAEDVASGQTFLQDIADVERTDLNDEYLENMATFLQSIDENSDAYDGIVVTEEIREALAEVDIDLRTASEEEVEQLIEQIGGTYVEEDAAMEHVEDMLVEHTDLQHEEFDDHVDDDQTESNRSVIASEALSATTADTAVQNFNDTDSSDLSLNIPSLTLPGEEEDGESNSLETEVAQDTAIQGQGEVLDGVDDATPLRADILADDDLAHSLPSASLSNVFDEPASSGDESIQTDTDNEYDQRDDSTQEQATAQTVDANTPVTPNEAETTIQEGTVEAAEETNETVVTEAQTVDEELNISTDELSIDLAAEGEDETQQADPEEDTSLDRFSADSNTEQTESNGLDKFSANGDTGSTVEMASVDELDNVEEESSDQIEAAGLSADDGIQEELPQESEQVDTNIG